MQISSSLPRSSSSPSLVTVRVLPQSAIMFVDRGWSRGHATLSFPDVPKEAPGFLPWGALRLVATEEMDVGAGYDTHSHENSESLAIVLAGEVRHEDDRDGPRIIGTEDVALLSAGTGIDHSEKTHGPNKAKVLFLFFDSSPRDASPRFVARTMPRAGRRQRFVVLAAGQANDPNAPIELRCDAVVQSAMLEAGALAPYLLEPGRRAYILAPSGAIEVDGKPALAGDRVLCEGSGVVSIRCQTETEVFVIDTPA